MKVKLLSRARLLATPWIAAYQAPPSMGFSRQEYWSGVPLPSPQSFSKNGIRDFPSGTMDKNPPVKAGDTGSTPAWGTKIPQATKCGQKIKVKNYDTPPLTKDKY